MLLVTELTNDAKQQHSFILPSGLNVDVYFEYKPLQVGWFMSISYLTTFTARNIRIVTSPNILHQFKNIIPFGMACFVDANAEPLLQDDFLSGRARFFILDADDVELYSEVLSGQIST